MEYESVRVKPGVTSAGIRTTGVASRNSGLCATAWVAHLCDHLVCTKSKRSWIPSSRIEILTLRTHGDAGVTKRRTGDDRPGESYRDRPRAVTGQISTSVSPFTT